jgi:hypothetical protein
VTTDQRISRITGVLEAEVDGDRVLMHPDDFSYFGLSETGSAVWLLVDGTRSVDDIVASLSEEYDAGPDTIRADVLAFLEGLDAAHLIAYEA